ncbi:sphinganine-1-phosphate aldolase [Malassezia cuniculi]|uniref:sphinganine-1-phosphate aldolase n=1 Tax=Malassezia cuniculi TaxID=948313 RepID=A0AAF0J7Q0_9BASI|nr:sphinganine-1-phosphate aldolase [Malassezia cuniculi]
MSALPEPEASVMQRMRSVATLDNARNLALAYVVLHFGCIWLRAIRATGPIGLAKAAYHRVATFVVGLVLRIPANRRRLEREMNKAVLDIESSLMPSTTVPVQRELPAYGRTAPWIEAQLAALEHLGSSKDGENHDGTRVWRDGRCSGAVYHGGDDLSALISSTIARFLVSNPLHPEVFPGVRKMEAEVVAMVLSMFHAPSTAGGATTSGGTESILMACKTMRDWARAERGIKHPEMVIPNSAHVAFDKAGHYFGIKVRRIPVDPMTRKVRIDLVARAITGNTIMLVGSAPNFPDGIIDDIVALGELARRNRIGLHVDCCLGSFLVPFLERAGFVSEPFDFRVDGVTSISCDTHKYGFAPKGTSVVMYRTKALRRYQYFVSEGWVGGVYASPTLAGSRPGALIAGAWATMVRLGIDGYTESCHMIVGAAKKIERIVREEIPELTILGKPLVSVVAISSAGSINIYDVADQMSKRGWHLNALAGDRPAFHIACTRLTVPVVDEFISDLKDSVAQSRQRAAKPGTYATVYGMGTTTPMAPYVIGEMASRFIDTMYKIA